MKKKTRVLALILAALMTGGFLASCSESREDEPETTPSADSTAAVTAESETVEIEPEEPRIPSGLPEKMDLEGYTITFYGKQMNGIYAEELTGESVNDAVFNRNIRLNDEYNFSIENILAENQEYAIRDTKTNIQAGDDSYQVLVDGAERYVSFVNGGLMYDLNTLEYQDFN